MRRNNVVGPAVEFVIRPWTTGIVRYSWIAGDRIHYCTHCVMYLCVFLPLGAAKGMGMGRISVAVVGLFAVNVRHGGAGGGW